MAMTYEELEKETRTLSPKKKAALARTLIDDLDVRNKGDIEAIWTEEASVATKRFGLGGWKRFSETR